MAMTLYGRKQDTLSHVLVSKGYESSEFYYPTPYSHNIKTYGGDILDAKYAQVVLTEIPFVRLRDGSPDKLVAGNASYSETVDYLNIDGSKEELLLDTKNRLIVFVRYNVNYRLLTLSFICGFVSSKKINLRGSAFSMTKGQI